MKKPTFDPTQHGLTGITPQQLELMKQAPDRLEFVLKQLLKAADKAREVNRDSNSRPFGAYRRTRATVYIDGSHPGDKPSKWIFELHFEDMNYEDNIWASALAGRASDRPKDLEMVTACTFTRTDRDATEDEVSGQYKNYTGVRDTGALVYALGMIEGVTIWGHRTDEGTIQDRGGKDPLDFSLYSIGLDLTMQYWRNFVEKHLLGK